MIIAEYRDKIGHHELQVVHAEEERWILQEELWRQQMEFREVHQQSLLRWSNYEKFQSSTFDTFARRKLIEDHNTVLELSGRVQELQNEVNCLNDSKDFQDAKSVRSGIPTLPVNRCYSLHILFLKGCWSLLFVSPRRKEGAKHLGHTWFTGERFCKSTCIFISALSSRIELSLEENHWGAVSYLCSGEKWKTRTKSRS